MKKKNGFTLIELLAVIVILAIIALIATPIVLNIINDTRRGAAERSAEGIRHAAQLYFHSSLMNNISNFEKTTITFGKKSDGTGKIAAATIGTSNIPDADDFKALKEMGFNIDGTLPTAGVLEISSDGNVISTTNLIINGWSCSVPNSGTITCSTLSVSEKDTNDIPEINVSTFIQNLQVGDLIKMTPTGESVKLDGSKTGHETYNTVDTYLDPSELQYWRVINKNTNGTVDVVSEYVSSTKVHFTNATGYANYIGYLNELANAYQTSYTIDARHMGYNGQTQYLTDTSNFDGTNSPSNDIQSTDTPLATDRVGQEYGSGNLKGVLGDTLYLRDYYLVQAAYEGTVYDTDNTTTADQVNAYEVNTTNVTPYWLASRFITRYSDMDGEIGQLLFRTRNNTIEGPPMIFANQNNGYNSNDPNSVKTYSWIENHSEISIRPILTLKSDITSSETEIETGAYILG